MKKNYFLIIGILLLLLVGGYFVVQDYSKNNDEVVVENEIKKTQQIEKNQLNNRESKIDYNSYDSITEISKIKENKKSIFIHNDYIEIHQEFKTSNKEFISPIYKLNLKNETFFSLSAYTEFIRPNIKLLYRYYDNNWTEWKVLPRDYEITNPKRVVFGLININENIEKIQFKSNQQIEKVVFNIFTPKN